jgi:hypothetical protein
MQWILYSVVLATNKGRGFYIVLMLIVKNCMVRFQDINCIEVVSIRSIALATSA